MTQEHDDDCATQFSGDNLTTHPCTCNPPNLKQMKTAKQILKDNLLYDHLAVNTWVLDDVISAMEEYATQRTAEVGEGWISVEKEPKEAGEYLCYNIENGVMTVQYYDLREWGYLASIKTVITHWQPLPEPPKNSEDGDIEISYTDINV